MDVWANSLQKKKKKQQQNNKTNNTKQIDLLKREVQFSGRRSLNIDLTGDSSRI